ncbi:MAG: hypothetical protein SGBAC_010188 [Bacillariaceae sp.]
MSNSALHSHRSTLPSEYLEAVRSMSASTMNRACEILLQPEPEEDGEKDIETSAEELLAMYHTCQSAFTTIQKHQPRLAPNLALNIGNLKSGSNPNAPNSHSLPLRKKSMLSAAGGGGNSGTISAKHGIMRSKKSLVPHGRRNLNDAISSDSPLAKKARLNNNSGGKSTTASEAPPKSALNFLNKLNRGGGGVSGGGDVNVSSSSSTPSQKETLPTEEEEYEFTTFQKAFVLIPKASGFLSMAGSMSIILHILRSKKRRKLVYHRLLLGMSMSDLISSFFLFLSSWLVPKGTKMYLASGTMTTCTVHGMLSQAASITTPSYNAALSIYYLLVVFWELPEKTVHGWEFFLHAWPITLGLGTGIAGLPLELYNPAGFHCWISGLPSGCDTKDDVECQRGNLSWVFRWAFFYAWIWFYFVVIAVCIGLVYYKVLQQERKNDRYNISGQVVDRYRSRRVANQAFFYVGAYYLTFLFGTISRSMQVEGTPVPEAIWICFVVFYPLQGFFNALIYMMPRLRKRRQQSGWAMLSGGGSSVLRSSRNAPFGSRRLLGRGSSDNFHSNANSNSNSNNTLDFNVSQQPSMDAGPSTEQEDKEASNDKESEQIVGNEMEDVMEELATITES